MSGRKIQTLPHCVFFFFADLTKKFKIQLIVPQDLEMVAHQEKLIFQQLLLVLSDYLRLYYYQNY